MEGKESNVFMLFYSSVNRKEYCMISRYHHCKSEEKVAFSYQIIMLLHMQIIFYKFKCDVQLAYFIVSTTHRLIIFFNLTEMQFRRLPMVNFSGVTMLTRPSSAYERIVKRRF